MARALYIANRLEHQSCTISQPYPKLPYPATPVSIHQTLYRICANPGKMYIGLKTVPSRARHPPSRLRSVKTSRQCCVRSNQPAG